MGTENIQLKSNILQNETHCIMNETDVFEMFSEKPEEIGFGASKLLTCNAYKTLKENNPLSYFDCDDDSAVSASGGGVNIHGLLSS